jgi:two-component system, OmpR family, osmolarity sensor histidine kinase EnvZ
MQVWNPFRRLKRLLPRGLFGRSLIIIVTPMVMLQGIVTYAFFVRHSDIMTVQMAKGGAADVAYLIDIVEHYPPGPTRDTLLRMAARNLDYQVSFLPGQRVVAQSSEHLTPHLKDAMRRVFTQQFGESYPFNAHTVGQYVDLRVQLKDGVLRLVILQKRLVAANADVFVLWMVVSSLVLLGVAILFLRNQVRPIERLASAAEAFGKGRAVPDFKPYGATEVRRAAQAFITMRARIDRFLQQRTEMLAGVSHDLKTPLTRLRLQLAMMGDSVDVAPLREDVIEMEHMLDEYLEFARGEGGEDSQNADLAEIVEEAASGAKRVGTATGTDRLQVESEPGITLAVKRQALKRCTMNLIDNALKHGRHVAVGLRRAGASVEIVVDDDGPGIPEARREEAFRPFHRLDEGRNLQSGGVGLGLAIARDIARAHGGDLTLATSPAGGLRATIRLPV